MKVLVRKTILSAAKSTALILFATEDKGVLWSGWKKYSTKALNNFFKDKKNFEGKAGQTSFLRWAKSSAPQNLLVAGLGSQKSVSAESYRQAAASAYKALKAAGENKFVLPLDDLIGTSLEEITQAITEGFILASYEFNELKKKKKDKAPETQLILQTSGAVKELQDAVHVGTVVAESTNFARRLGDLPGNHLTPTRMAKEAQAAAKGTALKVTAWDKARIQKERMDCFLSVNSGSNEPPKFIVMEYKGGKANEKPICFVGKGLTFDSGGISIKPSAGMEEMKFDMCGGAAVIATMLGIARLKLKVNAIGFVPATDNMPGPMANKPGDIRTARNGITVEINNTDAEGRLILSDALCYASEQNPKWIVDAATLTGAMVIALGNIHTGYFTSSEELNELILKAAQESKEQVWRMPVVAQHNEDMKGTYADLNNISASRGAGSATAAAFLKNFVPEEIPYAHFDIAGTAWNAGNRLPYNPKKGATGAIVRTFIQLGILEATKS